MRPAKEGEGEREKERGRRREEEGERKKERGRRREAGRKCHHLLRLRHIGIRMCISWRVRKLILNCRRISSVICTETRAHRERESKRAGASERERARDSQSKTLRTKTRARAHTHTHTYPRGGPAKPTHAGVLGADFKARKPSHGAPYHVTYQNTQVIEWHFRQVCA